MKLSVPSERNFEIYHAVSTQGMSRREAAAQFDVSPTRVHQIVEQVRYYLASFGSPELMSTPPELAELGALRISYDRMRYLYGMLMQKWRQSEATLAKGETNEAPAMRRALTLPGGNLRLVQQALRVTVEQTKIAGRMSLVYGRLVNLKAIAPSEPVEEVVEADDDAELPVGPTLIMQTTMPPGRGCTVPEAKTPAIAREPDTGLSATPYRDLASGPITTALAERMEEHQRERPSEQLRRKHRR